MKQNLDYGVIGNCRTAALVSKKGSIEWCCFPNFDSPSIFSKILDVEKGGEFGFEVSPDYTITQKYVDNTNILLTRFEAKEGIFEVLDFMPRYKPKEHHYYQPPEIYRYIRYVSGKPRFRVKYDLRFNYALWHAKHEFRNGYVKSFSIENEDESVFMYSSLLYDDIFYENEISICRDHFILLSYNQKLVNVDIARVNLEYQRTKTYWLDWTNRNVRYKKFHTEITRSMLVLKLMSSQGSGAVLAALTTSIPETVGEVRNWDYRFCWIRDASMSIDILLKMGHAHAARRFLHFVKHNLKKKHDLLQIMYSIHGEKELTESSLDHLAGFENSKPVRIGNDAYHQKQNDTFGYLMDVIYQYYKFFPGTLDEIEEIWEIVRNIMRTVTDVWAKKDKGIWEIRNEGSHFVFSKVMCWVAADRAEKIGRLVFKTEYANNWKKLADEIKNDVMENGWKEEINSFSQAYCNTDLDASLLLMQKYGFISAKDPKFVSTVHAVKESLYHQGLMYRYTAEDDFGKPSSAFTICTFWLIDALQAIGERKEALKIFKQALNYGNHLGLYSEDLDFDSKRQLGNFPQAYSHLAIIDTATKFSEKYPVSKFVRP